MGRWWLWTALVAGAGSLVASLTIPLVGAAYREGDAAAGWVLVEAGVLLVLAAGAVRVAPAGWWLRAAVLPAVAVPAWLVRFGWGPLTVETVGGFAAWTLAAVAAVTVGAYLRRLDGERVRSVTEARRAQRLQLARDLHDFVAHDVSGMLAQAQAGQLLAERDPAAAAAAFRRIEHAGLQALASLDRTVHMLRDPHDGPDAPPAALADVTDLVARFATTADIDLEIEPGLAAALPRELEATAYRVIVEALTNVRRHAPGAARVAVRVCRAGPSVLVSVADEGPPSADRRWRRTAGGDGPPVATGRRGGLGLPGLAERVEALGGTLIAGPCRSGGWRVEARLPFGDG